MKCKNPSFVIFRRNNLRASITSGRMPINEDPFLNCQDLKPKMMQPKTSRLETNLPWETGLKSTVRKKALIYLLANVNCCKVGASFNRSILLHILHCLLVQFLILPLYAISLTLTSLLRFRKNSVVDDHSTPPSPHCPITLLHHGSSIFCCLSFSEGKHMH